MEKGVLLQITVEDKSFNYRSNNYPKLHQAEVGIPAGTPEPLSASSKPQPQIQPPKTFAVFGEQTQNGNAQEGNRLSAWTKRSSPSGYKMFPKSRMVATESP